MISYRARLPSRARFPLRAAVLARDEHEHGLDPLTVPGYVLLTPQRLAGHVSRGAALAGFSPPCETAVG